jgi:hypothetical protein
MLNFYFIIKLLTHRINNFTKYILFITIKIYIPNNKNFPGILIAKNYSYAQYVQHCIDEDEYLYNFIIIILCKCELAFLYFLLLFSQFPMVLIVKILKYFQVRHAFHGFGCNNYYVKMVL